MGAGSTSPSDDARAGIKCDHATRHARHLAHQATYPLWSRLGMSRAAVQRWMAAILGIPVAAAQIALLSREQCERVVARIERLLSKLGGY